MSRSVAGGCHSNLQGSDCKFSCNKRILNTVIADLYTFYLLFEFHLCTVTFALMYGQYSKAASNQERVIVARVWQLILSPHDLNDSKLSKMTRVFMCLINQQKSFKFIQNHFESSNSLGVNISYTINMQRSLSFFIGSLKRNWHSAVYMIPTLCNGTKHGVSYDPFPPLLIDIVIE